MQHGHGNGMLHIAVAVAVAVETSENKLSACSGSVARKVGQHIGRSWSRKRRRARSRRATEWGGLAAWQLGLAEIQVREAGQLCAVAAPYRNADRGSG